MWNWFGRLLFPSVYRERAEILDQYRRALQSEVYCAKAAALMEQELACFRDNAAHSEALIGDLDAYITQCEGQALFYKNELRSLAYASDETIERETKHYAKNRDECLGEVARLKRMMAREQARVYELGRANDELVNRLKGKVVATRHRPEVNLFALDANSAQSIATFDFAQRTAADRARHAQETNRFHQQTGELKTNE